MNEKKVLILSASPRKKGNSDILCHEFMRGAQEADVIVVATPTYFLTMNGMLKTVIDRFLPKWKELGGHEVYFIITGHDSRDGLKLVETELARIFSHLGNDVKKTIWGDKVWKKGEVRQTPAMEEAYRTGKNC